MTSVKEDILVPADVIEPLEILMFEAIGMTAFALSAAAAGELTIWQWRALVVIGRADGMRVSDIASAIGASLPSTSRLVRRLERSGLVYTARDETDRRATLVRMTTYGMDTRQQIIDRRRSIMDEALRSRAPQLPRGLVAGLKAIAGAFQDYT